ncbi:hypothetical protein LK482_10590, partial [Ruminococcus callidus]|uniref:hypothetical protein n=1 Tax=Ruminococcus callidus TaxID=40519 RepID=UPI001D013654
YMKSENDCVAWDFSLALELLITRRSSVQIWLPQPRKVPKTRRFRHYIFLLFYRKIDFDPNLTPKHQKRKVEQDNTSCSISFID